MEYSLHRLQTTASTNDDVKRAAEEDAPEGTVVHALRQESGRGRQGKEWLSPEGNLYFSILLRPPLPRKDYGLYSFAVCLAIADAVAEVVPDAPIELKWPNDVLVGNKKISGILLESGEGWLVAGVGINVAIAPPATGYQSVCLNDLAGRKIPVDSFLLKVLAALSRWYEALNHEGFAQVRKAWIARAKKGRLRVRLPNKTEVFGEFADLDAQGILHLKADDGTWPKISAGDVFF